MRAIHAVRGSNRASDRLTVVGGMGGMGAGEGMRSVPPTPCFTAGTEIATDRGAIAIEQLEIGDRVLTRDNGYRAIRWIGARRLDAAGLAQFPELRPIRVPAGALAPGMPSRDLTVSPQHRLLLTGAVALDLGGETEVLAAAADIADRLSAGEAAGDEVVYYHILCDAHEIVWANGCWSESFHPMAETLAGLHSAQLGEILAIFPQLATEAGQAAYAPARSTLSRRPRLELVA